MTISVSFRIYVRHRCAKHCRATTPRGPAPASRGSSSTSPHVLQFNSSDPIILSHHTHIIEVLHIFIRCIYSIRFVFISPLTFDLSCSCLFLSFPSLPSLLGGRHHVRRVRLPRRVSHAALLHRPRHLYTPITFLHHLPRARFMTHVFVGRRRRGLVPIPFEESPDLPDFPLPPPRR